MLNDDELDEREWNKTFFDPLIYGDPSSLMLEEYVKVSRDYPRIKTPRYLKKVPEIGLNEENLELQRNEFNQYINNLEDGWEIDPSFQLYQNILAGKKNRNPKVPLFLWDITKIGANGDFRAVTHESMNMKERARQARIRIKERLPLNNEEDEYFKENGKKEIKKKKINFLFNMDNDKIDDIINLNDQKDIDDDSINVDNLSLLNNNNNNNNNNNIFKSSRNLWNKLSNKINKNKNDLINEKINKKKNEINDNIPDSYSAISKEKSELETLKDMLLERKEDISIEDTKKKLLKHKEQKKYKKRIELTEKNMKLKKKEQIYEYLEESWKAKNFITKYEINWKKRKGIISNKNKIKKKKYKNKNLLLNKNDNKDENEEENEWILPPNNININKKEILINHANNNTNYYNENIKINPNLQMKDILGNRFYRIKKNNEKNLIKLNQSPPRILKHLNKDIYDIAIKGNSKKNRFNNYLNEKYNILKKKKKLKLKKKLNYYKLNNKLNQTNNLIEIEENKILNYKKQHYIYNKYKHNTKWNHFLPIINKNKIKKKTKIIFKKLNNLIENKINDEKDEIEEEIEKLNEEKLENEERNKKFGIKINNNNNNNDLLIKRQIDPSLEKLLILTNDINDHRINKTNNKLKSNFLLLNKKKYNNYDINDILLIIYDNDYNELYNVLNETNISIKNHYWNGESIFHKTFNILLNIYNEKKDINYKFPLTNEEIENDNNKINNYYNILELLLKYGCNINELKDETINNGWAPIHEVCYYGIDELLEWLIKFNVDINLRSSAYETPLMISCQNEKILCSVILLKNDVNLYDIDKDGLTAMHHTAIIGNHSLINIFLNLDINIYQKDNNDKNLINLAFDNNHIKLGYFLMGIKKKKQKPEKLINKWDQFYINLENKKKIKEQKEKEKKEEKLKTKK